MNERWKGRSEGKGGSEGIRGGKVGVRECEGGGGGRGRE